MNYTSSITSKGQVTIPLPIRQLLGLQTNSAAAFSVNQAGQVVISKPKDLQEVRALLRKPSRSEPLSDTERAIGAELAKKYDTR